jgi:hypothetical protein
MASRVHVLVRLDANPVPNDRKEVRVFLALRNEAERLPWFFKYYRSLGAHRFFVVDNDSSDGTLEFLLEQGDCHVFHTSNAYPEANNSVDWLNSLRDSHGSDHWCLSVDADEQFVYPGCETVPLSALTEFLSETGSEGVFAFLLDMYGRGSIADTPYTRGQPCLEACPFFDGDYRWGMDMVLASWRKPFPSFEVTGGPRLRCFYPEFYRMRWPRRNLRRAEKVIRWMLRQPAFGPPLLTKIPLVRWRRGMRYMNSHTTSPIVLPSVTGALLHFKFLVDFRKRVMADEDRGRAHWASEYARYRSRLKADPDLSLFYSGSLRYRSSAQLVELGLIKDDAAWQTFRRYAPNASDQGGIRREGATIVMRGRT